MFLHLQVRRLLNSRFIAVLFFAHRRFLASSSNLFHLRCLLRFYCPFQVQAYVGDEWMNEWMDGCPHQWYNWAELSLKDTSSSTCFYLINSAGSTTTARSKDGPCKCFLSGDDIKWEEKKRERKKKKKRKRRQKNLHRIYERTINKSTVASKEEKKIITDFQLIKDILLYLEIWLKK